MADTQPDAQLGTVIAGYRIDEKIGRGGMGVVYRAHHLNLERTAAIKIIAPELAEAQGFRERFLREARIAASLQHPNVVTVFDGGEFNGVLYLAMRYIEGSDLASLLHRETRLGPYRAIDVCRQVASALDAAHALNLIHRDVKPGNVLVEGRQAFLTDFGLTKRGGSDRTQLTRAGDVVGTIHYAAPEQIEGRQLDSRTDVYGLGCLLFHCLTGSVPYERDSDVAIIYAHLQEDPPRPSETRPELPKALDAVIAKALDKRPERRFQTCGDLMSAAQAVMEESGPLAEPLPGRRTPAPRSPSQPGGRTVPPEGDPSDVRTMVGSVTTPQPSSLPPDLAAPPSDSPGGITPPPSYTSQPPAGGRDSSATDFALRGGRAKVLLAGLAPTAAAVARVALAPCDVQEVGPNDNLLAVAREQRPDLVLLDWNGAGRPAAQLVQALREDPITLDTQVMLVVERKQASAREVAEAGADDHVAAPFSPLQLQVKLRKLLGADALAG
jgi:serine/threonine protein kinase